MGLPTLPQLTTESSPWTAERYLEAVDASALKRKVRTTLYAMVDHAGAQYSTIDRATVLQLTEGRREATISAHWRQARSHGLLVSKQRFNATSIHKFIIPGAGDALVDELALGTPLRGHVWTPEELSWWEGLDVTAPTAPPWSDGPPPF
jgi:hypothetical protein